METKTVKLSEIFFNGKTYKVPTFQRDYSWNEENWEDLWNDALNILETNNYHYMGAIILKIVENDDELIIVDGQQRLATLIILAVAGIAFLDDLVKQGINKKTNEERIKILSSRFIGEKDATSLFYRSKLKLNRNDGNFFQEYILKRKKPLNVSRLKDSQKLLYKAYQYFYKKIKERFKDDHGEGIANFLENIVAKRLIFIQITVEDDLNAYTVFETLNARGIELTPTDLLKNYMFSLITEADLEIIEDKWYRIINLVGFKEFPTFLRYFLNSYREIVRKERLFKDIKKEIKNAQDVVRLLDDLEEIAYFYEALKNPYDEFWNDFSDKNDIIKYLEEMKLFKVTQPYPLLIAVYKHKRDILSQILRMVTVISFRYNIIGKLNPNEMERVYNKVAIKISQNTLASAKDIFEKLKTIYVTDEEFISMFSSASINTRRNKKLVKYILINIEKEISGNSYDYYDSSITIEHILPENPTDEWFEIFSSEEVENYVYRIGNLTLLEDCKNRDIGNSIFNEKKKIYATSKFEMTNKINFDEWSRETISRRQEKLGRTAKNIWRLDF
ncbi:hypothetical protein BBF96_13815 [Anoxybacter fermentans]|uniref:DUF262 domain-containing protein n=1 Tax=Anoxybacter fermentans TaxID=1323375 RepID=A0A3S9T358_9FIRM|nr:DUF262 domain-containing protein [Anoxybacter fermentans]AZR74941.1 hypothetical protein BBF96_13815 [Anoxybacter fermentans]